MSSSKGEIRKAVRASLASTPIDRIEERNLAICTRLLEWDQLGRARAIMAYEPAPPEVDLRTALREIRAQGKALCLPRIDWQGGTMVPAVVTDLDALVAKRHGILEPPDDAPTVAIEDLDLILVPGVAFDERCNRLGRGGGFYDRFLSVVPPRVLTVGVAFEAQVVHSVPMDRHDRPLDAVVTESRILRRA